MANFAILVPILWLVAIVLLIVLEAVTYQLVAIWFALGAAAALIASLLDASGTVQIVVFVAVSVISLIASRPLAEKIQAAPKEKTNAHRIVGQNARVIPHCPYRRRNALRHKIKLSKTKGGSFMPTAIIIIAVLILVILILLITNIKIVPQSMVFVVERLGAYQQTWETGLHFKVPFIDRVAKRVSLKEQVVDFKPQPVITRDNVTMQIDSVVFYQITDAKLFTYGVERPISAIENLTATTLRNIIGELELDHTLTSRDVINTKITTTLDTATDKWGIKVNRVEL